MNVKEFERKEKNTAELTVQVTPEEFEAAVQKAYIKGRGRIQIPGFRKGKAPRKMIEAMYGQGAFYEDAVEALAPEALDAGIREKELSTVGRPSILDFNIGEDKSLSVKFLVSLYPEVKLEGYKGIEAPRPEVNVTDGDVERELESVRRQNARIETAERPAQNGDVVTIDFEGFMDGKPFDGGKGENHDLELGSGQFIPGFEEQLVGKSAGEDTDVNVTFPEAYAPELAGKDATFKVHVSEVKSKELPALDDEFAKDVSEYDTLEEYKASVKNELLEQRRGQAQSAFEEAVMSRLSEKVEGDIPEAMIDDQVDQMMSNFRYNLASQGWDMEQYFSMMGMNVEDFRKDARPTAEKQIRLDLAFEYIAKTEDFPVSDEDVEAEYQRLADQYKMGLDEVKRTVTADSVKTGLKLERARQLVLDSAAEEKKTAKKAAKKAAGEESGEEAPAEEKPAKKAPRKSAKKSEEKPEEKAE